MPSDEQFTRSVSSTDLSRANIALGFDTGPDGDRVVILKNRTGGKESIDELFSKDSDQVDFCGGSVLFVRKPKNVIDICESVELPAFPVDPETDLNVGIATMPVEDLNDLLHGHGSIPDDYVLDEIQYDPLRNFVHLFLLGSDIPKRMRGAHPHSLQTTYDDSNHIRIVRASR